jgi:hypothetical protein
MIIAIGRSDCLCLRAHSYSSNASCYVMLMLASDTSMV